MLNLRLTTPPQHFSPDAEFELNPSALEKTLKELQQASMLDRISQLDAAITRFNEVKLESSKRIKLLEVYFTAYQKLLQGFDEMRIAQLNISAQQKKQVKKDIMWLYIKLSHGYKIVVKEFAAQSASDKPAKEIVLATFRAMELSYTSLLYSYRFDIEEPPLCYLEIHQIYSFAEFYNILDSTVRGAQGYAKTPTIESFYILCMLFSNLDPRQYESYTLEVLFLALQPMLFKCKLSKNIKFSPNSFFYRVNLNENLPSEILLDNKITDLNTSIRYIQIDAFMQEMQDWLNKNQNSENSLLIEQELELFPAILTRLKINHSQKSAGAEETPNTEEQPDDNYQLIIGLAPLESLLIMDELGMDLHLDFNESQWRKISESSHCCELLSCAEVQPEAVRLGELAAIVTHGKLEEANGGDASSHSIKLRQIGQIVALRQLEDNKLLIELEFIQGNAHPLTYRRLTSEDKTIDYSSAIGIYFTDANNAETPPQIVLANQHFRAGQHYLITTRERSFSIEACKLFQRSMLYSYFAYKVLQESVNNPNVPLHIRQASAVSK